MESTNSAKDAKPNAGKDWMQMIVAESKEIILNEDDIIHSLAGSWGVDPDDVRIESHMSYANPDGPTIVTTAYVTLDRKEQEV